MKRTIPYALTLTLALLISGIALAQKASPAKPSVPKGWSFSFPDGNQDTGKQLFIKIGVLRLPHDQTAEGVARRATRQRRAGADRLLGSAQRVPGFVDHESTPGRRRPRIHGKRRQSRDGQLQSLLDRAGADRPRGISQTGRHDTGEITSARSVKFLRDILVPPERRFCYV